VNLLASAPAYAPFRAFTMPIDQLVVCLLVLVMVALFIWERIPPDYVSVGVMLFLFLVPISGAPLLSLKGAEGDAVLGSIFANNGLLTVMFMFILGAALEKTGWVSVMGGWFEKLAGSTEKRILCVMATLAVFKSAFLNNTTMVVVFLPMVIGLCRRHGMAPSRFLIPLSYFAITGGLCTMIGTSTNLIVNGVVAQKGMRPFSIFEITPLGVCLAAVTLIYLLLVGRKLLPDRPSLAALIDADEGREFITAAIIGDDSPLVGKCLAETPLHKNRKMRVLEVRRAGNRVETPLKQLLFEAGDRLILSSHMSGLVEMDAIAGLELAAKRDLGLSYPRTEKAVIVEGMIGPRSSFAGHSLSELNFRQQYGVIILALHRQGVNVRENFENVRLEFGDTVLMEGSPERLNEMFEEQGFINLSQSKPKKERRDRAWVSALALVLVIVAGATEVVPFQWASLAAVLLVALGRCIEPDEIYQAVDWRIITMILGTLALGLALDKTGAARTIVEAFTHATNGWSAPVICSLLLLLTIIFTELLSNNAVAALLTPLAIELGSAMHVDPRPFVVAVMIGASVGFAIPAGYQTHMLVYGPGGYRFADFVRVGLMLDILLWIVASLLIPLLWKF
jgi:di/tricarboxylate transporter